jgi:hypothetical protein
MGEKSATGKEIEVEIVEEYRLRKTMNHSIEVSNKKQTYQRSIDLRGGRRQRGKRSRSVRRVDCAVIRTPTKIKTSAFTREKMAPISSPAFVVELLFFYFLSDGIN